MEKYRLLSLPSGVQEMAPMHVPTQVLLEKILIIFFSR